jgi:ribose/xylose/arabinose/galactoside ABC-type transport system permease subunit
MRKKFNFRDFFMTNGFVIVFVVMLLFFTFATDNFLQYDNLLSIAATATPWIVMATGLSYVIMAGSIDISIGSTLFISIALVNLAMIDLEVTVWDDIPLAFLHTVDLSPVLGIPIEILISAIFGCITGFLIVIMKINPLLASMGMMFVTRGLVLFLTNARVQNLPQAMMKFGEIPYFREFVIIVGFIIIMIMHTILERTKFGRQVMAIGNSPETAERLGVPVKRIQFSTYVIAAVMITIGGVLQIFQIGMVHQRLGVDYEFSALAAIVVGGISLFGGDGKIFPGLVLGGLTLVIAENGLTHMGVSPYAYPFLRGGIIFIAMLADAMKTRVLSRVHVIEEPELEEAKEGCE